MFMLQKEESMTGELVWQMIKVLKVRGTISWTFETN